MLWSSSEGDKAMTAIAHTSFTTTSHIDNVFAAMVGFCQDCFAGARDGREIETRYQTLSQLSAHDLARIGLTRADIAQAALTGRPR
jgi:hypothetical protein